MIARIDIPKAEIEAFCRRNRIRRLALFGSVLRDDFGPDSDVDMLVEFEPGTRVGFFELYDMEQEFSRLLGGRKVEMTTLKSLSKYSAMKCCARRRCSMSRRDPRLIAALHEIPKEEA